jgi:hypothetical protein
MSTANNVNVVVVQKRKIQVTANATAGIIDSNNPVTLKNNPYLYAVGHGVDKFVHLLDVDAANRVEGDTVVFQANDNLFVVKPLDMINITGKLDGGTF